jgi:2-polyprenyl-6-methoxyphenol hydroxylase-like FAD-dependent oxidoreductase
MLADVALDFDAIMAQALSDRIPLIETLDRLITSADRRRDKALSSIDRRREAFAQRLRRVAEDLASEPLTTPISDTEAA